MLARALEVIPLGSQTFSKSKTQFPFGVSPFFITRGLGSHVWDADGNKYIDFINANASITLGYNDPDVTAAVRAQLEEGTIFSLPHPIEIQVAEKIVEMVPCAEKVRFGKNGSDATAGAIRIARAYTQRDHVAVCGYHGWQDWYIGSTARNKGVPKSTQELTHTFIYNDIQSLQNILKQWPNQVAAVIMEPMNTSEPEDAFLHKAAELTRQNGAVFIFDETITGFRFANGGAQEYFGVIPDLATFGKGLSNGYPVSVVAGKADIMKLMEDVFFSFTFGGETLSLAAALATMTKLQKYPVIDTMKTQGEKILAALGGMLKKYGLSHYISLSGHPNWSFLNIKDASPYKLMEIKTLFLQEMFLSGMLTYGTHNLSYSHNDDDITSLLDAYNHVLYIIKDAVENKNMNIVLKCKPLEPLFKIR